MTLDDQGHLAGEVIGVFLFARGRSTLDFSSPFFKMFSSTFQDMLVVNYTTGDSLQHNCKNSSGQILK